METIGWGRRNGKTTKMINWWLEDPDNRMVICSTAATRRHTLDLLHRLYGMDDELWRLAQRQFVVGVSRIRGFHGDIGADDYDMLTLWDRHELAQHPDFKVYTVNK